MLDKKKVQDEFNELMKNYPNNYDLILKKSQELDEILYEEMLQMPQNKALLSENTHKKRTISF